MPPAEVPPPQNAVRGKHRIYATDERGWKKLCESRPKKLGGEHWEYEVGRGERIRYKAGPSGEIVVVYAGPAPSDTH